MIEPEQGVFDFTDYDRMALHAAEHGIRLEVLLAGDHPTLSARPPGNTDHCVYPPRDDAVFADFAKHVAERYGRGGTLWSDHPEVAEWAATIYEIWNEPGINVTEFGWASGGPPSDQTVSEAEQADLVKRTYLALWRNREELGFFGAFYYAWRDLPPPTDLVGSEDYWGLHTGLLHEDTTPKPALAALGQAAAAMN